MRVVKVGLPPKLVAEKTVGKLRDDLLGPVRVCVLSRDADRVARDSQIVSQLAAYFLASRGIKTKTL